MWFQDFFLVVYLLARFFVQYKRANMVVEYLKPQQTMIIAMELHMLYFVIIYILIKHT